MLLITPVAKVFIIHAQSSYEHCFRPQNRRFPKTPFKQCRHGKLRFFRIVTALFGRANCCLIFNMTLNNNPTSTPHTGITLCLLAHYHFHFVGSSELQVQIVFLLLFISPSSPTCSFERFVFGENSHLHVELASLMKTQEDLKDDRRHQARTVKCEAMAAI